MKVVVVYDYVSFLYYSASLETGDFFLLLLVFEFWDFLLHNQSSICSKKLTLSYNFIVTWLG